MFECGKGFSYRFFITSDNPHRGECVESFSRIYLRVYIVEGPYKCDEWVVDVRSMKIFAIMKVPWGKWWTRRIPSSPCPMDMPKAASTSMQLTLYRIWRLTNRSFIASCRGKARWKRVEGAEVWSGIQPLAWLAINWKDTTNIGTGDQTPHWEALALGTYAVTTPYNVWLWKSVGLNSRSIRNWCSLIQGEQKGNRKWSPQPLRSQQTKQQPGGQHRNSSLKSAWDTGEGGLSTHLRMCQIPKISNFLGNKIAGRYSFLLPSPSLDGCLQSQL